ncbi:MULTISPECIES: putative phage tail assembly chaperone [Serratia]|uniref:putative phage tail assembly chaperone n=1 Tax=Serratia TaxID=613 RepID=UPI000AF14C67|nr:putative phage tail assembly chaperone [Corynebacterium sp.]MDU7865301.1 putative phage tail assembly chaperone [Serratia marcescens]DAL64237.1 MAG TPA_asm: tail assembly chaperone protein [Caudoviricetes sp.]
MSKDAAVNKITLTIQGEAVTFEPNTTAYNSLINDMTMDNKVAPHDAYLRRIVSNDTRPALDELLKLPGAALQIAEAVNAKYAPKLEIEVKN